MSFASNWNITYIASDQKSNIDCYLVFVSSLLHLHVIGEGCTMLLSNITPSSSSLLISGAVEGNWDGCFRLRICLRYWNTFFIIVGRLADGMWAWVVVVAIVDGSAMLCVSASRSGTWGNGLDRWNVSVGCCCCYSWWKCNALRICVEIWYMRQWTW